MGKRGRPYGSVKYVDPETGKKMGVYEHRRKYGKKNQPKKNILSIEKKEDKKDENKIERKEFEKVVSEVFNQLSDEEPVSEEEPILKELKKEEQRKKMIKVKNKLARLFRK